MTAQLFSRHQQLYAAILYHICQPFGGIRGVQGNIGPPGLHNSQQYQQQSRRALQGYAHPAFQADPRCLKQVSQLVTAPLDFSERQTRILVHQGNGVRARCRLLAE